MSKNKRNASEFSEQCNHSEKSEKWSNLSVFWIKQCIRTSYNFVSTQISSFSSPQVMLSKGNSGEKISENFEKFQFKNSSFVDLLRFSGDNKLMHYKHYSNPKKKKKKIKHCSNPCCHVTFDILLILYAYCSELVVYSCTRLYHLHLHSYCIYIVQSELLISSLSLSGMTELFRRTKLIFVDNLLCKNPLN